MRRFFTRRAARKVLPSPALSFPCPKRWEELRPAGPQERFCDQCQHSVHDLSAMSHVEAVRFLREARGKVCISYRQRADGSMLNQSVAPGRWRQVWRRGVRPVLALLAMLTPMWLTACASRCSNRMTGSAPVMGRFAPPPTRGGVEEVRTLGTPVMPPPSK